jgi:hypothetical protein
LFDQGKATPQATTTPQRKSEEKEMSGVDDNLDDLADYEYEEEQQKETKGTTKAEYVTRV